MKQCSGKFYPVDPDGEPLYPETEPEVDTAYNAFEDLSSPRKPVEGDFIKCQKYKKSPDKRHLYNTFGRIENEGEKYFTVNHYQFRNGQQTKWRLHKKPEVLNALVYDDKMKARHMKKRESMRV